MSSISVKLLPPNTPIQPLVDFLYEHGVNPMNHLVKSEILAYMSKIISKEVFCWSSYDSNGLMTGFLTLGLYSDYWTETLVVPEGIGRGRGRDNRNRGVYFCFDIVVSKNCRGQGIGRKLCTVSAQHPVIGLFAIDSSATEIFTTVHKDNIASRSSFIRGGYSEVITYKDHGRGGRYTTVLKRTRPSISNGPSTMGNSTPMLVVGLQSGNAVDGIDVGIFAFEPVKRSSCSPHHLAAPLRYKTIANKTFGFTRARRDFILKLRSPTAPSGTDIAVANYELGIWFAECVLSLLKESNISPSDIHVIGSHGQTIRGHPHFELGSVSVIAQLTGITTIGDFRPADVAQGGNGTPCTCSYDSIMLRSVQDSQGQAQWRTAINIGGTSSVTFLPPWTTNTTTTTTTTTTIPVHGLDPGLGVFFIDLAARAIDSTLEYDEDGKLARGGQVDEELLSLALTYKYYQQDELPIGVGPDDFPESLFSEWQSTARSRGVSDIDILTTMVELTTVQLSRACAKFGGPNIINGASDEVIVRGGVLHNSYFMERLKFNLKKDLKSQSIRVITLQDLGIDEDSWENAMYAMFGYLAYNNIYNFMPSATGASKGVVGGTIAPGANYHSITLTNDPN